MQVRDIVEDSIRERNKGKLVKLDSSLTVAEIESVLKKRVGVKAEVGLTMIQAQKKYMNEFLSIDYKTLEEDLSKHIRIIKNKRASKVNIVINKYDCWFEKITLKDDQEKL